MPKTKNKKYPLKVLLPIICAIGLALFFLPRLINSDRTKQETECNSLDEYYGAVKSELEKVGVLDKISLNKSTAHLDIIWKRNINEPYIGYPAKIQIKADIKKSDADINQIYREILDPKITAQGFIKNDTNTTKINNEEYDYGYTKGDTIITARIDLNSYNKSIYWSCGNKIKQYDDLYNDLLQSKIVKNVLQESYGENGLKNMIFRINNIYQNNVIETGIGSYDWHSGFAAWFHKENNGWSEIAEGQDVPECSLLEKYKVNPGVDCFDPSDPTHTTTR